MINFKKPLLRSLGLVLINFLIGTNVFAEKIKPCNTEEYRQFDFWIGNWQVSDAQGKVVGTNNVFPIMNGCALSENWNSTSNNPGVSYNFYDQANKHWHQTWVDAHGGVLYLDGKLINGAMVLKGERPNKDNGISLHKISWSPQDDGRIKQHWEMSTDKGKSWKDIFVGFYEKIKE